jgi:hypothetical protein
MFFKNSIVLPIQWATLESLPLGLVRFDNFRFLKIFLKLMINKFQSLEKFIVKPLKMMIFLE